MGFITFFLRKNLLNKGNAFVWNSKEKNIKAIKKINTIDLKLLVGVEKQKKILLKNTENFAIGNFTNNALLWGTRGNGKSTLIKSVFLKLSQKYTSLKLIQLNKNNIFDIEKIYPILSELPNMRFIIFIDDLSFEKIDSDYKIIKSTLDGSIQNQPTNIVLYVTSNRRHLMPRDMIDNERSSAIHTDESVEEKISLSDRFGLWIGFHNLSQKDFLNIVKTYCKFYKINYSKETETEAIRWSIQRGNQTGRSAWQFIIQLAAEKDMKLIF
jgi:predicted AAA+ superfamily ATPase